MITSEKIEEITRIIVEGFQPKQVFLIGSYATGNSTVNSDLDLLIIKDSDLPRHHRANSIRKSLIGNGIPMDILVYTPDEFDSEKSVKYSFLNSALKDARVLYDSAK